MRKLKWKDLVLYLAYGRSSVKIGWISSYANLLDMECLRKKKKKDCIEYTVIPRLAHGISFSLISSSKLTKGLS